jgi:type IV pilus assembly protein PilB
LNEDLLYLARHCEHTSNAQGAVLLAAGQSAPWVGLLLNGKASLMVENAALGTQQRLDRVRAGEVYGALGLLLGTGTPISVVADADCESLLIDKKAFEKVARRTPDLAFGLAQKAASRLVRVAVMGSSTSTSAAPAVSPPPAKTEAVEEDLPEGAIAWVDVGSYKLTDEIVGMLPVELIRKHRVLPLQLQGNRLTVGMVVPTSIEARQEVRRVLHTVDPHIVAISSDHFSQAYVALKLGPGERGGAAQAARTNQIVYSVEVDKKTDKGQTVMGSEVIGMFDRILLEAVDRGASDIHIEPEAASLQIRYRIQGSLVQRKEFISPAYAQPLVARIKVLAEMDITDRRLPQDGRILARLGNMEVNLRVSTMAAARGEKAVIRIIDSADAMRPLHQIFLNPKLEKAVRRCLAEPFGAVIVAGPTGSGKSSTLYSMVNERKMARQDTNVVTVEDPVEYLLQGVTQVPVAPRVGFGFSAALRALMRQDPDVIMVGELRDAETTSMMVEAALTGHLCLTSIHGNTSAAVIQRLQHLGIEPILLSQALSLVVAQRLARRLCPNCAAEAEVAPALLESLVARKVVQRAGTTKLPRPVGCDACGRTGFLGRVAVQEVLVFDDALRILLADNPTPAALLAAATERHLFTSFAESAAYLMARRILAPSDALLVVAE